MTRRFEVANDTKSSREMEMEDFSSKKDFPEMFSPIAKGKLLAFSDQCEQGPDAPSLFQASYLLLLAFPLPVSALCWV